MADNSTGIVSAVISQIQLLNDLNELCCDIYGGETDDEDNLVTIAAKAGFLSTDSIEEDEDCFGLSSLTSEQSSSNSTIQKLEDNYSIGFAEITVGLYTDYEFRQQFHMSRRTVECLCRKLIPLMLTAMAPRDNPVRSGRPSLRLEKKILITLWYLSNQQTFRAVGEKFEVSTSTVEDSLRRTVSALVELAGDYIHWPVADSLNDTIEHFRTLTKIKGIRGVIGIARFRIKTVKETPKIYADSKLGGHTVTVQFVSDNYLRFIDCYAGLPGASSDASILRTSDLYARATTNQSTWFPENSFLVGGISLPLEQWLITPFLNNGNLCERKLQFNEALNIALHKLFETLALLKGRFQRLNMLELGRLDYLPICVSATFVLHNFCLVEDSDETNYVDEYIRTGLDSVLEDYGSLLNHINEIEIDEVSDPEKWIHACESRNNICENFSEIS